jgi:DNA-binding MarR family transcriptional regulator
MKQMLSERTAAALVALAERPSGLRLAELARLTGAPLSSAQRTVEALLDEGLVVREGARRPRYRMAPEAPADALSTLAAWRLTQRRAAQIRQQTAAIEGDAKLPRLDLEARLREVMTDQEAAQRLGDMAERLVWWQRATQTIRRPERLIAQAMAVGTSEDAERVEAIFGTEAMRRVLAAAPAGIFDSRRWDYWHLRFGYKRTPPMPTRPA